MENLICKAEQLTFTMIHGDDPQSKHGQKKTKEFTRLNQLLNDHGHEAMKEVLLPIVAVRDPVDNRLLIYSGNIETLHALENNYELRLIILFSQEDLTDYLKDHPALWFEIEDLNELLKFMRIYAQYPELDKQAVEMPKEFQEMITAKRVHQESVMMYKFFHTFDDD